MKNFSSVLKDAEAVPFTKDVEPVLSPLQNIDYESNIYIFKQKQELNNLLSRANNKKKQ